MGMERLLFPDLSFFLGKIGHDFIESKGSVILPEKLHQLVFNWGKPVIFYQILHLPFIIFCQLLYCIIIGQSIQRFIVAFKIFQCILTDNGICDKDINIR